MTNSEIVFKDFIDILKNGETLLNRDISFMAKVIYEYGNIKEDEILKIRLNLGYNYGKLDIADGKTLTPEKVHLTLNTAFDEFSLTNEGFLVITGSSQKLGNYKITIIEI